MDERQTQIVEGAGLEESRINEDLIAFLNKWSFPAMLVIAVISGGYYLKNAYERRKVARRDQAFAQLGAVEASQAPSVFSLTEIANQFEGVGSVAELARLRAADLHLEAARTGIDPADGVTELSDDDRAFHLEQARGLYRQVLETVADDPDRALIAVNAAFGLGAVAETQEDQDSARTEYERAKTLAESAGFAPLAKVAQDLIEGVGAGDPAPLPSKADLPRLPFEPDPDAAEATDQAPQPDAENPQTPPAEGPATSPATPEDEADAASEQGGDPGDASSGDGQTAPPPAGPSEPPPTEPDDG